MSEKVGTKEATAAFMNLPDEIKSLVKEQDRSKHILHSHPVLVDGHTVEERGSILYFILNCAR